MLTRITNSLLSTVTGERTFEGPSTQSNRATTNTISLPVILRSLLPIAVLLQWWTLWVSEFLWGSIIPAQLKVAFPCTSCSAVSVHPLSHLYSHWVTWRAASMVPREQSIANTVCAHMCTHTHAHRALECGDKRVGSWGGLMSLVWLYWGGNTLREESFAPDPTVVAALGPDVQTIKSMYSLWAAAPSFRSLVFKCPRSLLGHCCDFNVFTKD